MAIWAYYKEAFADGSWALFRSTSGRKGEAYNFRKGWIESDLLFDRRQKGDIDVSDIIPEDQAQRLIAEFEEARLAGGASTSAEAKPV